MKNKLIIGTVLTGMLLMTTKVEAMGNAKVMFTSNDNIQVGDTFTVSMSVADINDTYDGIVSMGGNLSFDSSMVEYVSSKGTNTPYTFQINEDYNYKIAGLDFTLENGIRETLTVYEFTFKALKEGNTTITLENAKLTDSQDYINTIVLGKEITIEAKEEVMVPETTVVDTKVEATTNEEKTTIKEKIANKEIEEKIEFTTTKEQETNVEQIQTVLNNLVSTLKDLFK